MNLKQRFLEYREHYVIDQVRKAQLPEFHSMEIRRYRIVFSGRVQHVGFRLEVKEMAKRLGLTGLCKNLENGSVFVELQGQYDKIKFLVSFMKSLKRIVIKKTEIKRLPVDFAENGFYSDRD